MSSGIPGILPRVVPPEGALVKNEFIPGGVRAISNDASLTFFTLVRKRSDLFYTCRQLFR